MTTYRYKEMLRSYGFDEVALVPGDVTINPEQIDTTFTLGNLSFSIPILVAAMDAVVDPRFAILFSKLGGLAVLNLEGVQTRYEEPEEILAEIVQASPEKVTPLLQRVYSQPIKEHLIRERITSIKQEGGVCAVSVTPANTKQFAPLIAEAGADVLVVQSTVTTARHISKSPGLIFSELCQSIPLPIIVGNCASYSAALELMRTGISGILVGIGPGATCTTREVLGVGVPQVTATMECAAAREEYFRETGRYVAVITDGGIHSSGDLCKAFAFGADAVMLGAILAQAREAPGRGYHWGMASPHPALPRGTRIKVGTHASMEQILFGPSSVSDGTQNLIGALRTTMGVCGVSTIRELQKVEVVIAPAIKTEGKAWQFQGKIYSP
ncbi:MAG TPA: GuaB3 family IMP dehydrogenase-related protein [Dehalococcoidia bacterium]|nr:GuaB3 family IMP dehydrogenase-related protein [Dehalococcoidia bacterium]